MRTTPSVSQLLCRAALTAIAVAAVLAAGDLSERQFDTQIPWIIKGTLVFILLVFIPLMPFSQTNRE